LDERKNKANRAKHGVWFEEAQSVFDDPRALLFCDPDHSEEEERFIFLGVSFAGSTLVVVHCHKESEELFHIISARKANKKEVKVYEEGIWFFEVESSEKPVREQEKSCRNQFQPRSNRLLQGTSRWDGTSLPETDRPLSTGLREAAQEDITEMGGVVALKQFVAQLVLAGSLSLVMVALPASRSQDKKDHSDAAAQQIAKRCNPVLVKNSKLKAETIRVREGEKSTGYTPIIAFEIASTGEVVSAHVKRSSGIRDIDDSALSSIRSGRYNSRPGCPVVDSEADVLIDLR
jgi:uncharacterized protein